MLKVCFQNTSFWYTYPNAPSTVSNCIVVFLRLLTSAAIRTEPETFAPFLYHPETGDEILPQEFCERYVEACGKEAGSSHTGPVQDGF